MKNLPNSGQNKTKAESEIRKMVEQGDMTPETLIALGRELQEIRNSAKDSVKDVVEAVGEVDKQLSPEQQKELLNELKSRFIKSRENFPISPETGWEDIQKAIMANPQQMWSLQQMQLSGGEPNIIGEEPSQFIFADCSVQCPHRNCTYDKKSEDNLKERKPEELSIGNAVDIASALGVDVMNMDQYLSLQEKFVVDTKTITLLKTPDDIRKLGVLWGGRYVRGGDLMKEGDTAKSAYFTPKYIKMGKSGWLGEEGGFRAVLKIPKT